LDRTTNQLVPVGGGTAVLLLVLVGLVVLVVVVVLLAVVVLYHGSQDMADQASGLFVVVVEGVGGTQPCKHHHTHGNVGTAVA
jgi:hypothetical protein